MKMKRFLMFLIVAIVTISISLMVYYFVRDEEVVSFNLGSGKIYVNKGETLSLDDLGFVHKKPNATTEIDFNAGGDSVTSKIVFDEVNQCYIIPETSEGGDVDIVITTTHKKYPSFTISVCVGVGSEDAPYLIRNEKDLKKIGKNGSRFGLNDNYLLVSDIYMTGEIESLGEFTGSLSGGDNFYTIYNLKVNSGDAVEQNVGLFTILSSDGEISNLVISNASIKGKAENMGVLAGTSNGVISKVKIVDSKVVNNAINSGHSYTGGFVGSLVTTGSNIATIKQSEITYSSSISAAEIMGNDYVGGIAGLYSNASIAVCKSNVNILNADPYANPFMGGLVATVTIKGDTSTSSGVRESYSSSRFTGNANNAGALFYQIENYNSIKTFDIMGVYALESNFDLIKIDNSAVINKLNSVTAFIGELSTSQFKTLANLKYYQDSTGKDITWETELWNISSSLPQIIYENNYIPVTEGDTANINSDSSFISVTNESELINALSSSSTSTKKIAIYNDIDLKGAVWNPVNLDNAIISTPDNKVVKISNFSIVDNNGYAGFFKTITNSTVKNLCFDNVTIAGDSYNTYVGILAGIVDAQSNKVSLENISVSDCVIENGQYIGGLIGLSKGSNLVIDNANLSNVKTSINQYNSSNYVGGIVGSFGGGKIINSNVSSTLDKSLLSFTRIENKTNKLYIGGLVGFANSSANISDSNFSGSIIVNYGSTVYLGGIVGRNYGKIQDCLVSLGDYSNIFDIDSNVYFVGGIAGENNSKVIGCGVGTDIIAKINGKVNIDNTYAGGISGVNKGEITESYFSGSLEGLAVGGLTGRNSGTITYCYVGVNPNDENAYSVNGQINLTGTYVAGLTAKMSNGLISDCYVNACLSSNVNLATSGSVVDNILTSVWNNIIAFTKFTEDTSQKAGLVVNFLLDSNGSSTIRKCVSTCTFTNDSGENSLECSNQFMKPGDGVFSLVGVSKEDSNTGTILNCVLDKEIAGSLGAKVEIEEKLKFLFWTFEPLSGSSFTATTTAEMQSGTRYASFNEDIWNFAVSGYPELNVEWTTLSTNE